jgi:L-ascorbate metabolism protein UlaG (beta-lactamase superfamily)
MVTRSLERIDEPVDPAPRVITTPVLDNPSIAVSWIGHATVLVQIKDKVFITDPLFTDHVGMVVKRYIGPGLDPSLLPRVDFTLISHIHFDHFSYGSLDMLPKNGTLIIPLGLLRYTPDFGFRGLKELKPWESIEEDGVSVTAVPVQHFSGRYGIDNAWLGQKGYTGYVIEYNGTTVFVGGDTGYHPELFKEIGRRYRIDVALLPIAPGSLTNLGGRVHVGPPGAIAIMRDLKAAYMVPMHHRTMFYGTDSNPTQAIDSLRAIAAQMGISDRIIDLDIGEQRVLSLNPEGLPAGQP